MLTALWSASATVTDPAGCTILAPNAAGEFQLCEEVQPGWVNTDPGDGTACKPFTISEGPLYAEFYPTASDLYGVELTDKSLDQRQWTYGVYQYFDSKNLHYWTLDLPSCIGAGTDRRRCNHAGLELCR